MYEVRPKTQCDRCGSTDVVIRFSLMSDGREQAYIVCKECGYLIMLPKVQNVEKKRTNSTLEKWSLGVRIRDKGTCVICGSRKGVQAHHIIPVRNDVKREHMYNENNGVTLCGRCHWLTEHRSDEEGAPC